MSAGGPLVVVGDALLDRDVDGTVSRLAPDAPAPVVDVAHEDARPGGAGLAAWLAARAAPDRETVLVTALGGGPEAELVRARLAERVTLVELPLDGSLPVKTRIRAEGRPLVRVDQGGGSPGAATDAALAAVAGAGTLLVADYGRGCADVLRDALAARTRRAAVVWDPHPRGGPPVPGVRLATPNRAEACGFAPEVGGHELAADARRAALLAQRWRAGAVAVTLGAGGALLGRGADSPMLIPAPYAAPGDPCGAGDCFAATAAAALADGRIAEEAVERAVLAAADFVAAGGVSAARTWTDDSAGDDEIPSSAQELAASVRARGGTVVATGGCFDLLHAGHVGLLESARRLGDCLVVCLNSDDSVRRLKGAGRPLNSATDRARVLLGLGCVDAVAVFDEDTPEAVLRTLRPHLWVKGGDYTAAGLPEAAALAEWGGDALVLPYLDGHSTSALARRAALATEATPP